MLGWITQWAAVRTVLYVIKTPPQRWCLSHQIDTMKRWVPETNSIPYLSLFLQLFSNILMKTLALSQYLWSLKFFCQELFILPTWLCPIEISIQLYWKELNLTMKMICQYKELIKKPIAKWMHPRKSLILLIVNFLCCICVLWFWLYLNNVHVCLSIKIFHKTLF